jgi:autotransporter translocation and assembly factor TamB
MSRTFRSLIVAAVMGFAALVSQAADVTDASGTWQFTIQDTGRVFTPSFTLTQQGDQLTGTYKNSQGDNPASGTVKGNEVTLNAQITGQDGNKRTVTYVGTLAGDTMTGKMQTTRADVTFVAKREKK